MTEFTPIAPQAQASRSDGIVGPRKAIEVELFAGRDWQEVVSPSGVTSYVSRLTTRALVTVEGTP
jgi:hypothetical protein